MEWFLTVHDFFFPAVGLKLSRLITNASGCKKGTKKEKILPGCSSFACDYSGGF